MSQFRFDDLQGRLLVLTGAAHGIGRELSRGLAGQGVRLVLIDRDEPALTAHAESLRGEGATVTAEVCDLADSAALEALLDRLAGEHETIDAVMHNAAVDPRIAVEQMTAEQFHRIMAINVDPALALVRGLLNNLRRSDAPRVLLVGSITFELGAALMSAYTASKGAIVALTRTLAHELGSDDITVNCIAPGAIQVEKEQRAHVDRSARDQQVIDWQAVKRRLTPADLLGLTCLLLSEAGGGISGQVIGVDGGFMHPLASAAFQGTVSAREA
ncbi:MAG: SDR family NAD(P)-dependent oxidoreductase [Phycisphaeraceae bacterium]